MSNPSGQGDNTSAPATPAKDPNSTGNPGVGEVLEAQGHGGSSGVVMKSKKLRQRKDARQGRSKRSDFPDGKTVICSAKSNSESSQDGWLDDIVKDSKKTSKLNDVWDFIQNHKFEVASGVVITGLVIYFIMKKNCARKCPFTGKSS